MKIKNVIYSLILILFFSATTYSQSENYEYGELIYASHSGLSKKVKIFITLNGESSESDVIILEKGELETNCSPATKELKKLSEDGWKVYNTNVFEGGFNNKLTRIYQLRRKITE